jgi:bifunctional UDP-N-acetylglucosamine pyrophosphorylase/glucosamine-1-phosphate N-acetyltransferase
VETRGYHVDLDKPWHILEATQRLLEDMSRRQCRSQVPASSFIHEGADIQGHIVLGEHCTIGDRVVVRGDLWMEDGASLLNGAIIDGPAIIGRNTVVRDYCLIGGYSTLGARGVYAHGAEFTGVALEAVHCHHYCEIWGVAGQAVDFGAATVCGNLRFDDGDQPWRVKGMAETPTYGANAVYFGDYCRTGVNAMIMPGQRVGVYSCIGPGVIAYDDIPDRQMVLLNQDVTTRPWGPERYGW